MKNIFNAKYILYLFSTTLFFLTSPTNALSQQTITLNTPSEIPSGGLVVSAFENITLNAGFNASSTKGGQATFTTNNVFSASFETVDASVQTPPTGLSTNYSPGSLPGTIDVSSNGAGTYSIPIDIPAGSAGFAPSLGISYNSGGGEMQNGGFGNGWTLSGISSIIDNDLGNYGSIESNIPAYEKNTPGNKVTKYSLDGQRLVKTANNI